MCRLCIDVSLSVSPTLTLSRSPRKNSLGRGLAKKEAVTPDARLAPWKAPGPSERKELLTNSGCVQVPGFPGATPTFINTQIAWNPDFTMSPGRAQPFLLPHPCTWRPGVLGKVSSTPSRPSLPAPGRGPLLLCEVMGTKREVPTQNWGCVEWHHPLQWRRQHTPPGCSGPGSVAQGKVPPPRPISRPHACPVGPQGLPSGLPQVVRVWEACPSGRPLCAHVSPPWGVCIRQAPSVLEK